MTYRDELEASRARSESLAQELAEERARRQKAERALEQLQTGAKKQPNREKSKGSSSPQPLGQLSENSLGGIWRSRTVRKLLLALGGVLGLVLVVGWFSWGCPVVKLRSADGDLRSIVKLPQERALVVSRIEAGDFYLGSADLRFSLIRLADGALLKRGRFYGGKGDWTATFLGVFGDHFWVEGAQGVVGLDFSFHVRARQAELLARWPEHQPVEDGFAVTRDKGLFFQANDGFWYQIEPHASSPIKLVKLESEKLAVSKLCDDECEKEKGSEDCKQALPSGASFAFDQCPNSPRECLLVEGKPVGARGFFRPRLIRDLSPESCGAPIVLADPPSVLVAYFEQLSLEEEKLMRYSLAGKALWILTREKLAPDRMLLLGDQLLVPQTYNDSDTYALSAKTGKLLWAQRF